MEDEDNNEKDEAEEEALEVEFAAIEAILDQAIVLTTAMRMERSMRTIIRESVSFCSVWN